MKLYRRHVAGCPRRAGGGQPGRHSTDCACPFWLDFKFEGKRKLISLQTVDPKEAEVRSHHAIVTGAVPNTGRKAASKDVARPRLAEYIEQFVAKLVRADKAERTITNHRRTLDALAKFGVVHLDEIDAPKLDAFYASRKGRLGYGAKPSSLVEDSKVLRRFCDYCIRQKAMTLNPTEGEERPKDTRVSPPPFTDEQVAAIIANAPDNPTRVLVELLITTGLRIGDACTLRRDAIDETGTLELPQRKSRYKHVVVLPLNEYPKLIASLNALPRVDESKVYYFWDGEMEYLTLTRHWSDRIQKAFKAAKVSSNVHRLRHTCAIRWLRAGIPIHEVSMLLGHQNVLITQRYYAKYNPQMKPLLTAAMRKAARGARGGLKVVAAR
jgi:integrase/recombinase XerC